MNIKLRKILSRSWTDAAFKRVQLSVKEELLPLEKDGDDKAMYILKMVDELKDTDLVESAMRCFVLIIQGLLLQARYGELKASHASQLYTIGKIILKTFQINTSNKRFSKYHIDLHLALSQAHRRLGKHFQASWENEMANMYPKPMDPAAEAFREFTKGNRLFRLGYSVSAIQSYKIALSMGLPTPDKLRCLYELMRVFRLSHDFDAAKAIENELRQHELPANLQTGMAWEAVLRQVHLTGDLSPLMLAVKIKHSHHQIPYVLEAYLWASSMQSQKWLALIPKPSQLLNRRSIDFKPEQDLFNFAVAIERCHDATVPLRVRLMNLGRRLSRLDLFSVVDHEILALSAAMRFLTKVHANGFCSIILNKYQSLSMTLSANKNPDILGVGEDIKARLLNEISETIDLKNAV